MKKDVSLCEFCKTGRESYILDKNSFFCPYISCWKDGKCDYFSPICEEQSNSKQN